MATSWLNLVDNHTEEIHKIICKECNCVLEYKSVKDNLIKHKFLSCNDGYSNKIDDQLKKDSRTHWRFLIIISTNLFFCEENVYIKYMDDWEKFNESTLPEEK